jgi:hypothetical protein
MATFAGSLYFTSSTAGGWSGASRMQCGARVSFRFPTGTRFPSLPVVGPDDYGLVYPREGEAYATAAEIAVARRQGAEIKILEGVIVPGRDDGCRPFMLVIKDLQRPRDQHPKGSRRWVVERTLAWLNRNRRLAKDFEASIASAKAWVYIASVQLLIRRLALTAMQGPYDIIQLSRLRFRH